MNTSLDTRPLKPEPLQIYAVANGFVCRSTAPGALCASVDDHVFINARDLGRHVARHFGCRDDAPPAAAPKDGSLCGTWVVDQELPPDVLWTSSTPSFSSRIHEAVKGRKLIYRGMGWLNNRNPCAFIFLDAQDPTPRWNYNGGTPALPRGDPSTYYIEVL